MGPLCYHIVHRPYPSQPSAPLKTHSATTTQSTGTMSVTSWPPNLGPFLMPPIPLTLFSKGWTLNFPNQASPNPSSGLAKHVAALLTWSVEHSAARAVSPLRPPPPRCTSQEQMFVSYIKSQRTFRPLQSWSKAIWLSGTIFVLEARGSRLSGWPWYSVSLMHSLV